MTSKEEHLQDALYRERIHGETIAELRAEVERLKGEAAHLARDRRLLHDENERLRAELAEWEAENGMNRTFAREEMGRLRAALREIADIGPDIGEQWEDRDWIADAKDRARDALF